MNNEKYFDAENPEKHNAKPELSRSERRANERKIKKAMEKPSAKFIEVDPRKNGAPEWMSRLFRNNKYIVMIDDHAKTTKGSAIKAMIRQNDAEPIKNHWAEIQRIKNEIFGSDAIAVEYYPAEEDLADVANIYWIWLFPAGVLPEPI